MNLFIFCLLNSHDVLYWTLIIVCARQEYIVILIKVNEMVYPISFSIDYEHGIWYISELSLIQFVN